MLKKKKSILVLFWLFFAPSMHAQLGQITTVVGMASKYATLLKSHQNDIIYADETLDAEISEHMKLAIIPFNTMITYVKQPSYTEEEATLQFENQQMVGKMMQEAFWDVFDNYQSEVDLQDIRITNKILQDIGYGLHPGDFPPSYLAQLLDVDAVLICTYDITVDNEKTGWQNLSKALSDLAVSQLKGNIPGLSALKFIKNPNVLIDAVTKPGAFYEKLKSGDISSITAVAGSLLPEGNWTKIADIAAKNSKTITKLAKGDTSNLFSDLVSNNAELLGSELKLNTQVVKLIQNNSKVAQNIIEGNTKGLMFDIISSNVGAITSKYVGEQNSFLATTIGNNSSIIAKLATGDTTNLLNELLDKNIGQVTSALGGNNASFYSNIILNNKELVGKALKGDFTSLTTDLLANNLALVSEKLPIGDAQKYAQLLSNKDAVKGLLSGNTQSIVQTLTQSGVAMFGEQFGGTDVQKFANIIANNKAFLESAIAGNPKEMLNSLLSKDSNLLGTALSSAQLGKLGDILSNNSETIIKLASGDTSTLLQDALNNNISTIMGSTVGKSSSFYTDLIVKNKDLVSKAVAGDFSSFASDLLSNNTALLGEKLLPEDAKKYASLLADKEAIKKVLEGDSDTILATLTQSGVQIFGSEIENVDIQKFATLISANKDFLRQATNGDVKSMITTLLNKDSSILGSTLDKSQIGEFGSILVDNSQVLAKIVNGESIEAVKDVLTENVSRIVGSAGDGTASFYTQIILNNKDNLNNVLKGDVSHLVASALSSDGTLQLGSGDFSGYASILTDKSAMNNLLSLDSDGILASLKEKYSTQVNNQSSNVDLEKLAVFISANKNFIGDINSGAPEKIITGLLQKNRTVFGKELNFNQISELGEILATKKEVISNLLGDSSAKTMLSTWLSGEGISLDVAASTKVSELLITNKDVVSSVLKGDSAQLATLLGGSEADANTANILIKNKSKINQLLGIAEDEDFSILSKTPEELQVIAYKLSENKGVLDGIIKGDAEMIDQSYSNGELQEDLGIDKNLYKQIAKGLTQEQKTVAEVIVNSKVNQMLIKGEIDLQFFDFGDDVLSARYDNVSLREKTFSQTTASILDPTLDPKDQSKFTINIFGRNDDKVLWQYINDNSKTRLYDMNKTVANVVKRLNKNFPYFTND